MSFVTTTLGDGTSTTYAYEGPQMLGHEIYDSAIREHEQKWKSRETKLSELCRLVKSLPNRVNEMHYPGGKENYVAAMNRACQLSMELSGEPQPNVAKHVYPAEIQLRRVINDLEAAHRALVEECRK